MTGQELLELLQEMTPDELALEVRVGYNYGDYYRTHATGPVRGVGVTVEQSEAYSHDHTGVMSDEDRVGEDGVDEELDEDANRVIVVSCHPKAESL